MYCATRSRIGALMSGKVISPLLSVNWPAQIPPSRSLEPASIFYTVLHYRRTAQHSADRPGDHGALLAHVNLMSLRAVRPATIVPSCERTERSEGECEHQTKGSPPDQLDHLQLGRLARFLRHAASPSGAFQASEQLQSSKLQDIFVACDIPVRDKRGHFAVRMCKYITLTRTNQY